MLREVGAVTALVKFGEVWTPIMLSAFQDLFGGPQSLVAVFAGCQSRLLKFLKDNYCLKGFWLIHTPRVFSQIILFQFCWFMQVTAVIDEIV